MPRAGSRTTCFVPRARNRTTKRSHGDPQCIREDVCDRLAYSDTDCEDIEINVKDGEVILTGSTQAGESRREIERIAESVPGVKDVTNQIRTKRDTGRSDEMRKGNAGETRREPTTKTG